jgi:hypothetical protein
MRISKSFLADEGIVSKLNTPIRYETKGLDTSFETSLPLHIAPERG